MLYERLNRGDDMFSSGFWCDVYMVIGMELVDYVFIIKYISAAYLIWLGYKLLKSKATAVDIAMMSKAAFRQPYSCFY